MSVDPDLFAQALAEIRAMRSTPVPAPSSEAAQPACCGGDRAGYLRHRWHKETPCQASREANTAYSREYVAAHPEDRERRRRREQQRRRGAI